MYADAVAQKGWRAELTLQGLSSNVIVPGVFSETIQKVESRGGSNLGIGLSYAFTEKTALRFGYQRWRVGFSPTIALQTPDRQGAIARETGYLHYDGIALRFDRTFPYFFWTGGFDFSFKNTYKNDTTVEELGSGKVSEEKEVNRSMLTRKFAQHFSFVLGAGPSIALGKKLILRGEVNFLLPLSPIYKSGARVNTIKIDPNGNVIGNGNSKVNLYYFPTFKYGLNVIYKL
jgi:hypothetical protein